MIAHLVRKALARLTSYVFRLAEARKRRIAHDQEFYRNLKAYCRVNNISPVCEDDWKTWAADKSDDMVVKSDTAGTHR
jgi:hypothetical protein